ncbi:helix-hairpin-helix domain-containing protein [Chitinivibrio alkaliphilus]|uniref:Tex-like protein n=1 Tax=Chitinivibrio alkaliphilus ACht1 TaxID=1313304 RepID=U7D667_9BACT|nr:Tex-like N-terminal domain-containing protein [Chitinivibrio alkaliphilus]ERP31428.1 Tex-like protein [Chitinivibrio alkaliphilus ACht1]
MDRTTYIQNKRRFPVQVIRDSTAAFDAGATVHFLARYRKEMCAPLTEEDLFTLLDDCHEYTAFIARKNAIEKELKKRDLLHKDVIHALAAATCRSELEQIYLPFKQSRTTKAESARRAGLTPVADHISTSRKGSQQPNWSEWVDMSRARRFGYTTKQEVLAGAAEIIQDRLRKNRRLRSWLTARIRKKSSIRASKKKEAPAGSSTADTYDGFSSPLHQVKPHALLALMRGQKEKLLTLRIEYPRAQAEAYIEKNILRPQGTYASLIRRCITTALSKDLLPAIKKEVLREAEEHAHRHSIDIFSQNLKKTLLAPPAGAVPVLAMDPGYAHGCKCALLSAVGEPLKLTTVYLTSPSKRAQAKKELHRIITAYHPKLIGLGNGCASRETRKFLQRELLPELSDTPSLVMVQEAGASVYSASVRGRKDFPQYDITLRSAISLGRRLQDPLSELIKIPPHALGLGQYQHDVPVKALQQNLHRTVEQVVHRIGADLNTASEDILATLSGLNRTVAQNIISHRSQKGPFSSRHELRSVLGIGPQRYTQAVGFVRVKNGDSPLENTGIHPEQYPLVEEICRHLACTIEELCSTPALLEDIQPHTFTFGKVHKETLEDIFFELRNPGLDPRQEFSLPEFNQRVFSMDDLHTGMEISGVVVNVTDFGAFVDLGIGEKGLIHISHLSDHFVEHPLNVIAPGEFVRVRILSLDTQRKRIGLSLIDETSPSFSQQSNA